MPANDAKDYEKGPAQEDAAQMLDVALEKSASSALPSPVQARPAPEGTKPKLTAATIIPIWIVLSSSVIIYNNYLYNTLQFRYPVFLVTWHLTFAAVGTRVLQRTTHLVDGARDVHVSKELFLRSILPIGILFSASLILSNTAYLYLSVAYIQMLKVRLRLCLLAPVPVSRLSLTVILTHRLSSPSRSSSSPGPSAYRSRTASSASSSS
ncbi:hypothetical protein EIP86_000639 [Pleurotus ostreatoroseus]|nr:hypothetical protein EIP86_000639 [Pleurotus ostreatoroseus]